MKKLAVKKKENTIERFRTKVLTPQDDKKKSSNYYLEDNRISQMKIDVLNKNINNVTQFIPPKMSSNASLVLIGGVFFAASPDFQRNHLGGSNLNSSNIKQGTYIVKDFTLNVSGQGRTDYDFYVQMSTGDYVCGKIIDGTSYITHMPANQVNFLINVNTPALVVPVPVPVKKPDFVNDDEFKKFKPWGK